MQIRVKDRYRADDARLWDVSDIVERALNPEPDLGAAEQAQDHAENCARFLGRLTEHLMDRGLLSIADLDSLGGIPYRLELD